MAPWLALEELEAISQAVLFVGKPLFIGQDQTQLVLEPTEALTTAAVGLGAGDLLQVAAVRCGGRGGGGW